MTRGEAINARARAGARMVEARDAFARLPKTKATETIREIAGRQLAIAEIDYAAALGVEFCACLGRARQAEVTDDRQVSGKGDAGDRPASASPSLSELAVGWLPLLYTPPPSSGGPYR